MLEYNKWLCPGSLEARMQSACQIKGTVLWAAPVVIHDPDPLGPRGLDLYAALLQWPLVASLPHVSHHGLICGHSLPHSATRSAVSPSAQLGPWDTVCSIGEAAIEGASTDLGGSDRNSRCLGLPHSCSRGSYYLGGIQVVEQAPGAKARVYRPATAEGAAHLRPHAQWQAAADTGSGIRPEV